jgi:hypothetical protein
LRKETETERESERDIEKGKEREWRKETERKSVAKCECVASGKMIFCATESLGLNELT